MGVHDFDIARLQAKDEREWDRLQAEYHDRIFSYVKRQIGDFEKACDLTQETLLGAVKGIARFNPKYNIEQFLMGIARNKVIDHLRRKRPEIHVPDRDDESTGFFGTLPDEAGEVGSAVLESRERVLRQRGALVQALREMVAGLKEKGDYQRLMIIELCFLTQWKHERIAERVGLENDKAIAGIKFRAIRDLQARLRRRDARRTLFSGLWEGLS